MTFRYRLRLLAASFLASFAISPSMEGWATLMSLENRKPASSAFDVFAQHGDFEQKIAIITNVLIPAQIKDLDKLADYVAAHMLVQHSPVIKMLRFVPGRFVMTLDIGEIRVTSCVYTEAEGAFVQIKNKLSKLSNTDCLKSFLAIATKHSVYRLTNPTSI